MNERERSRGGRRVFDLPSCEEIERAARGADGRLFPWGNRFDWSLTCTYRSSYTKTDRTLHFPTDCSPFGVRDLAGSLAEITRDEESPWDDVISQSPPRDRECRVKGGSAFDDLEPYFHLAGYTVERKKDPSYRMGLRLVAYPRGRR